MRSAVFYVACLFTPCFAQTPYGFDSTFKDDKNHFDERKVIPWPNLQSDDVMFVKRVERIIDVREKQNQPMDCPSNPLSRLLYKAVLENKLLAFDPVDLKTPINIEQFVKLGSDTEFLNTPVNGDYETYKEDTVVNVMIPELRIKRYKIIEDWIYDKKQSQYFARIICIIPQYQLKIGGIDLGWVDLCALKYYSKDGKDIRHLLVKEPVFNRQNQVSPLSYDDWFEQRLFASYIVKMSNPWGTAIREEAEFKDNGIDALLEAEKMKRMLQEKEENLYED